MNFTKITDSASIGGNCNPQYSSRNPFNCDNTRMLILEPGHFGLYDVETLQRIGPLTFLGDSNEPIWSRSNPNVFYSHRENSIYTSDLTIGLIRTFTEYTSITFGGESDISEDGDHIAVVGTKPDGTREAFLYRISTNDKSAITPILPNFDACYVTPDLDLLISYGPGGLWIFNTTTESLRQLTNADGHHGIMRDADGSSICIWTNSNENPVTLPNFPNGIVKIELATGKQVGLLSLDWSLAVHISCTRKGPFCIVETYDPKNPNSAVRFGNAILQVPINGNESTELFKHGSNSSTYDGQPRASIAGDASRFIFGSNQCGPLTDTFYAAFAAPTPTPTPTPTPAPSPTPTNPTVPMFHYPDQQGLTAANFPAKPGEGGFVWDGKQMHVILHDGQHKFAGTMTNLGK